MVVVVKVDENVENSSKSRRKKFFYSVLPGLAKVFFVVEHVKLNPG